MATKNVNGSFAQFTKDLKSSTKKLLKNIDNSVKSTKGKVIYALALGVFSSFFIFNLGSVTSQALFSGGANIVNTITKTDTFETTTVKADVQYNTVLSSNYAYRNWHSVSSNKQSMFVDGNYMYVVDGYNHPGEVVLTKYDAQFKQKSKRSIEIKSYGEKVFSKYGWDKGTTFLYGNFYMADDYYYLVLIGPDYGAQAKDEKKLNAPGIRIVKLNKLLFKVDTYDISYTQIGATRPGGWSNMAIAVSDDGSELSLSTGFDGFYDSYASGVGTGSRHQIGLQLILDTKTMTLKKRSPVWATHTLGQHVIYDGEDRVFVDAVDASPVHGLLLSKVTGEKFSLSQNKQASTATISAYVYMNMNIGGVAASEENYLAVYNTMDERLDSTNGASHNSVSTEIRDIRVLVAPKNGVSNGTIITLQDYISTKETPLTQNENTRTGGEPRITALNKDNFLVTWYESTYNGGESFSYKTTCYMIIDGNGNIVQDVIKDDTLWLNTWSYPVYNEKSKTVYWFNDTVESTRIFYSLKVRV